MDEHLTWSDHITELLTSCYAALAVLRKLRNLAPYHVRRRQAVSWVISVIKTGLCVCRLLSTPRLSNETAAKSSNNVCESCIWALCCFRGLAGIKMATHYWKEGPHKALYDDTWPEYLRLKFHTVSAYNLGSLEVAKLAIPAESGNFQDSAARLFNVLPNKFIKGEGHSKERIFFVITNKKFILSRVTHRSFGF